MIHIMIVNFFSFGGFMLRIFHVFLDGICPSTFPTVSRVY